MIQAAALGFEGLIKRDPPRLSVVIPAFERPGALRKVLEGLANQTFPATDFEVIVVIDGAHPEVVDVVETFRCPFLLRFFPRPHQGETAARNFGLSQAAAEFIVSLDDDGIPAPRLLERHIERLESEECIVVCGDVRRHPASPQKSLADIYDWSEAYHARITGSTYKPFHIDLPDNNFSTRRSHLLQVGGWDEGLKGYGGIDDWELGYRLEQFGLGFRFEPGALVYHFFSKTFQSILEQSRTIGKAQVYYFQKHPAAVRDLIFPRLVTGGFWRRWLVLGSRHIPSPILKLISRQVAPLLDKWKLIHSTYFSALFVQALRGPFLCRGFWDHPDFMKEIYRRLRIRVPIVVCNVGQRKGEEGPEKDRKAEEALGHKYALHFEALKSQGYQTISIDEFNTWRTSLGPLPNKPLLLTFQGDPSFIGRNIFPLVKRYGFCASYFWKPEMLKGESSELSRGAEAWIGQKELSALCASGMEIESLPDFSCLAEGIGGLEVKRIIEAVRDSIRAVCGRPTRFLAYEANGQEFEVLSVLKETEIWGAIGPDQGINDFNTPQYALRWSAIESLTSKRRSSSLPRSQRRSSSHMGRWKAHWSTMTRPTHILDTPEFYETCAKELRSLFGELSPRQRVLELGCGSGSLYPYLGFKESEYQGIDFSQSMLAVFRSSHPGVHLVCADASSYYHPTDKFDLIFSNALIQYFDSEMLDEHFSKCKLMLNAGGRIVIGLIPLSKRRLRWYGGYYSGAKHLSWTRLGAWFVRRMLFGDPIGHWHRLSNVSALARRHQFRTEFVDSCVYPFAVHAVLNQM